MKYSKPEIAVLGDALGVIQDHTKSGMGSDSNRILQPVYDLDE